VSLDSVATKESDVMQGDSRIDDEVLADEDGLLANNPKLGREERTRT
jgi:hypothetical protein